MNSCDTTRMQCMEVWGGNQPFTGGVVMAGLDAWIHSRPYAHASSGGDIHYVSSCATGRVTRLLVADVSGHGDAVAEAARGLRELMRRYVNYIDQTRFVREMNQQFTEMSAAERFATAVVATFYGPTGQLSVTNAGHPPPLHYLSRAREWRLLENRARGAPGVANIPLGVLDVTAYDQFDLRLDVGDLVVCYTDSLIESRGDDGEMLGTEGLLKIVREMPAEAEGFVDSLLDAIRTQHDGNLSEDDVTVLLIRPNGIARDGLWKDRMASPFRVIRSIVSKWLGGDEPAAWPELTVANIGGAVFRPLGRLWKGRAG